MHLYKIWQALLDIAFNLSEINSTLQDILTQIAIR